MPTSPDFDMDFHIIEHSDHTITDMLYLRKFTLGGYVFTILQFKIIWQPIQIAGSR